jgi:putative transposase
MQTRRYSPPSSFAFAHFSISRRLPRSVPGISPPGMRGGVMGRTCDPPAKNQIDFVMDTQNRGRRSIRLRGYDYSRPGAYFVTLCVQNREWLFGNVVHGVMHLNESGKIVQSEWLRTLAIRNGVILDSYVVMPNHFHGILIIRDDGSDDSGRFVVGATGGSPLRTEPTKPGPGSRSLGAIMSGFKSITTKRIHVIPGMEYVRVWQRNYYERIIRDDRELNRIRWYIINNPKNWDKDVNFQAAQ